jgi:hypothetical protein
VCAADLDFVNHVLLGNVQIARVDRADGLGLGALMEGDGGPQNALSAAAGITKFQKGEEQETRSDIKILQKKKKEKQGIVREEVSKYQYGCRNPMISFLPPVLSSSTAPMSDSSRAR